MIELQADYEVFPTFNVKDLAPYKLEEKKEHSRASSLQPGGNDGSV